jgi:hypothetical protein
VSVSCGGRPTRDVNVAPGKTTSILTNWTGACSSVTLSSSNGWDTNFDNLVVDMPLPDLTITSFTATSGSTSQAPRLTFVVANQGSADSGPSDTFDIHVLANLGRPPTPDDNAYVAHVPVPRLAAGESRTIQTDVMPNKLAEGKHTLSALADGHNIVLERSEGNNHRDLQVTISGGMTPVTFDDRADQNRGLDGQYPTGVIDWGSGKWFHSGPWRAFTTKSVSFVPNTTAASFNFVSPRRLVSMEAFNGGSGSSTVTLSCSGQPTKSVTLAAGQRSTISTGWSGTCSTVSVTSSNGWDTNFDNLNLQ